MDRTSRDRGPLGAAAAGVAACGGPTPPATCADLCPAGTQCAVNQLVCIVDDCGDAITAADEACDDVNARVPEECDDGNWDDDDGCSAGCTIERCGNGILDRGALEVRDGGDTVGGDRCDATCWSDERCGNAKVDSAAGEECDEGALGGDGRATCDPDCTSPVCGDLFVNLAAGEQCEPPDGVRCDDECRFL